VGGQQAAAGQRPQTGDRVQTQRPGQDPDRDPVEPSSPGGEAGVVEEGPQTGGDQRPGTQAASERAGSPYPLVWGKPSDASSRLSREKVGGRARGRDRAPLWFTPASPAFAREAV